MSDTIGEHLRAALRVRPINKREMAISEKKQEALNPVVDLRSTLSDGSDAKLLVLDADTRSERESFKFDDHFWSMPAEQAVVGSGIPFADQKHVYDNIGERALISTLAGYNSCIMAYGQTGSGKTHTLFGMNIDQGLVPRFLADLFSRIESDRNDCGRHTTVVMSFFEIYNEKMRCLVTKIKDHSYPTPRIRQHPTKGVFVEGILHKQVDDPEAALKLIEKGLNERAMTETKMGRSSARSHTICQLQVETVIPSAGVVRTANMAFVECAGSEKIKLTSASGDVITEAKNINMSLSALRKVIDTLVDNSQIKEKKKHKIPPYRDSVLTYVLSDHLCGGNSKLQMIATVSPHEANMDETLNTLRYCQRARDIACEPKVNEEPLASYVASMKGWVTSFEERVKQQEKATQEALKDTSLEEWEKKSKEATTEVLKRDLERQQKHITKLERFAAGSGGGFGFGAGAAGARANASRFAGEPPRA